MREGENDDQVGDQTDGGRSIGPSAFILCFALDPSQLGSLTDWKRPKSTRLMVLCGGGETSDRHWDSLCRCQASRSSSAGKRELTLSVRHPNLAREARFGQFRARTVDSA